MTPWLLLSGQLSRPTPLTMLGEHRHTSPSASSVQAVPAERLQSSCTVVQAILVSPRRSLSQPDPEGCRRPIGENGACVSEPCKPTRRTDPYGPSSTLQRRCASLVAPPRGRSCNQRFLYLRRFRPTLLRNPPTPLPLPPRDSLRTELMLFRKSRFYASR